MEKLHIAVCDDEPEILEAFSYMIAECFSYHNISVKISKFNNPLTLARTLKTADYDLLFLDIDMPQVDGITFAKKLREAGHDVDIIYVSNKEELVFQVFDIQPFGFIRKNNFFKEIAGVIRSYVKSRDESDSRRLVVHNKGDILTLDINKAVFFEGNGKKQKAFMINEPDPLEVSLTMQELEERLNDDGFLRVHRGYLVNYKYINSFKNTSVTLTDGRSIPLSRRIANDVKLKYLNLMKMDKHTVIDLP